MSDKTIHLSLLDNSHAFLREAIRKALAANTEIREWPFAIVALVQSLELSMKAILHKVHPILIYTNVDEPSHTVSPAKAMQRLMNKEISGISLTVGERLQIDNAVAFRNRIIHSDFELKAEFASGKFMEMLAFVVYFQGHHLGTEIEQVVDWKEFQEVLSRNKNRRDLELKARQRIKEEGHKQVWECPNCGSVTFVATEGIETCYTCRHSEGTVRCPRCENSVFEWQLDCIAGIFEMDRDAALEFVQTNYGYSDLVACSDCIEGIKADLAQREEYDALQRDYYSSMEEEYYHDLQREYEKEMRDFYPQ